MWEFCRWISGFVFRPNSFRPIFVERETLPFSGKSTSGVGAKLIMPSLPIIKKNFRIFVYIIALENLLSEDERKLFSAPPSLPFPPWPYTDFLPGWSKKSKTDFLPKKPGFLGLFFGQMRSDPLVEIGFFLLRNKSRTFRLCAVKRLRSCATIYAFNTRFWSPNYSDVNRWALNFW